MSYKKRIVIVFIVATLFAVIMFIIKEGPKNAQAPDHEHGPGIIEEHDEH